MAYLRISHLTIRQTDCHTAGISLNKRALAHQLVHNRRPRLAYCIMIAIIIQAVAVQNHQYYWFLAHVVLLPC